MTSSDGEVGVLSTRRALAFVGLSFALAACEVVDPGADAGPGPGKRPGEPFVQNVCFQCSLRACSIASNACVREAQCARWIDCVAACPTDETGVAAEAKNLRACGLPPSAQVLFDCVQDFSTGFLPGCELACAPL